MRTGFPVHYEGRGMRIYTNPCGEIFVENIASGLTMRFNSGPNGGLVFTTEGLVEPIQVSNMIGWRISPRR